VSENDNGHCAGITKVAVKVMGRGKQKKKDLNKCPKMTTVTAQVLQKLQ